MPEIWLEPARFGYDWNVASEVAEIEAQTDRVALDVSPRVPAVVRQAKRYQYLIPRSRFQDGVPKLCV